MKTIRRLLATIAGLFAFAGLLLAETPSAAVAKLSPSSASAVEASANFAAYVRDLRVVGEGTSRNQPFIYVSTGTGKGQKAAVGDIVNRTLGVKVLSIDLPQQIAVFQDSTGAQLEKKYPELRRSNRTAAPTKGSEIN